MAPSAFAPLPSAEGLPALETLMEALREHRIGRENLRAAFPEKSDAEIETQTVGDLEYPMLKKGDVIATSAGSVHVADVVDGITDGAIGWAEVD